MTSECQLMVQKLKGHIITTYEPSLSGFAEMVALSPYELSQPWANILQYGPNSH